MSKVGATEAGANFAQLLARVARGESITIENHGVAVAVINPVMQPDENSRAPHESAKDSKNLTPSEAIEELKRLRQGLTLGGLAIREAIEEGRR